MNNNNTVQQHMNNNNKDAEKQIYFSLATPKQHTHNTHPHSARLSSDTAAPHRSAQHVPSDSDTPDTSILFLKRYARYYSDT